MNTSLSTNSPATVSADWLVLVTSQTDEVVSPLDTVDSAMGRSITAATARGDFDGKPNSLLTFFQAPGVESHNVVVVGVGETGQCNVRTLRHAILAAFRTCCTSEGQAIALAVADDVTAHLGHLVVVETFADCATSAYVDADVCKSEQARHPFGSAVLCVTEENAAAVAALEVGAAIGSACNLVKDLVNRPANEIHPVGFAERATQVAQEVGLELLILGEDELRKERMGAMLAVAQGSDAPPRLVKLSYRGAGDAPALALVGKGVTFDSGGYSIKPSDGMITMKADMAGAATVLGVVAAAAKLKLNVNVSAYMGLVENMISGNAYRLGDVLTARNGTTIEVHNTDAEGRLVLADVLAYAVDDGASQIVDFATLTGACVVGLGTDITGAFPNDAGLNTEIEAAADAVGEFVWEMPMHDHFDSLLKSSVADCKNVGPRWGGAVTAAKFLQKFVGDVPWVHLDIAGPSWAESCSAWQDAGATASPVRTIVHLLRQRSVGA